MANIFSVTFRDGSIKECYTFEELPIPEFEDSELSSTLNPSFITPVSQTRGRITKVFTDMVVEFSTDNEKESDFEEQDNFSP